MADNAETCSNCGTENPVGQDFCIKCHQPLTASAEEGVRESRDAQDRGGLFGTGGTAARGTGTDVGIMGGGMLIPDEPTAGDDPMRHEGLPPRRS